ncbi:MAG: Holliday junction branch migration protein RuvA [Bacteroidales bacterium]|nr:Holliday junction branch migration protein RuvA [Bacteroidales bacterium]
MYEYLNGKLIEKNPAFVIIDCQGVGYFVNISLNTYTALPDKENCKLFIHFIVREDAQILYGFVDDFERNVFRNLLNVSGVGASTARMILSTLTANEVIDAIAKGDVDILKSVKGIGLKSAQRIIIDLKGKLVMSGEESSILSFSHNSLKEEALSGLVVLGFSKAMAEKGIEKVLKAHPEMERVEQLIKEVLKLM